MMHYIIQQKSLYVTHLIQFLIFYIIDIFHYENLISWIHKLFIFFSVNELKPVDIREIDPEL